MPIVQLDHMVSPLLEVDLGILLKFECNNPGGSHKTRAARRIVQDAIAQGDIIPEHTTVIEKTGGNFGFGLAVACHEYGVSVELAVGLSFSPVKRHCLEIFGAQLIGLDMLGRGATPRDVVEWHLARAADMGKHYFYTDQFNNSKNVEAHEKETGAELAQQLRAWPEIERLMFVACAGTGASITGITRALRHHGYAVETILVEPAGCDASRGIFVDHKLEGMAVGVAPPLIDWSLIQSRETVRYEEMLETQRWLSRHSGYYIGNTSAACLSVARKFATRNRDDHRKVIAIAYDHGHWYLTPRQ